MSFEKHETCWYLFLLTTWLSFLVDRNTFALTCNTGSATKIIKLFNRSFISALSLEYCLKSLTATRTMKTSTSHVLHKSPFLFDKEKVRPYVVKRWSPLKNCLEITVAQVDKGTFVTLITCAFNKNRILTSIGFPDGVLLSFSSPKHPAVESLGTFSGANTTFVVFQICGETFSPEMWVPRRPYKCSSSPNCSSPVGNYSTLLSFLRIPQFPHARLLHGIYIAPWHLPHVVVVRCKASYIYASFPYASHVVHYIAPLHVWSPLRLRQLRSP